MITIEVLEAGNLKEKIIGLIGRKKTVGLMIKTRFGIHTFGLKFPIDVVVLNKDNKVATIRKNLMPGRIFLWKPSHKKILELPVGTVNKKGIRVNDLIEVRLLP